MLEGKSRLRNPIVADVFHKMAIIEKWGTEIRRMSALGQKSGVAAPIVQPGGSSVSVSFLRSAHLEQERQEVAVKGHGETTTEKTAAKIVRLVGGHPTISMRELAEQCGVTPDGIYWHLKQLKKAGIIYRVGPAKGGHWVVVDTEE